MVKSKKGTPVSAKKGVSRVRPWSDLPQQLVQLITKQSALMQSITAFGVVTKSWKTASRRCNPTSKPQYPQLFDNGEEEGHLPKDSRIWIREGYIRWYRCKPPVIMPYPWEYFVACSNGLLVAKEIPLEYFLWAPEANGYTIRALPPLGMKRFLLRLLLYHLIGIAAILLWWC